jgi:hypothetical protein
LIRNQRKRLELSPSRIASNLQRPRHGQEFFSGVGKVLEDPRIGSKCRIGNAPQPSGSLSADQGEPTLTNPDTALQPVPEEPVSVGQSTAVRINISGGNFNNL